jgi:RimJ/RimL family protein N-acetyltransferase
MTSPGSVQLRDVVDADLPIFFEHQRDPVANHMLAFNPRDPADREAFNAHWAKILGDDTITIKSVLLDGEVAGNVMDFVRNGLPEVGYAIGRPYWGKGVATRALELHLRKLRVRPLYAAAATDNLASIRVLEKCGFAPYRYDRVFAGARGTEIDAVFLRLD